MRQSPAVVLRTILLLACLCVVGMALMFAVNLPMLYWLIGLGLAVKYGKRWKGSAWSHGSARMADLACLVRHRLVGTDGLILGTTGYTPKPTRWQGLAALFSPSTSAEAACSLFQSAFSRAHGDRQQMIRLTSFVHLMTCAPVGKGKGVSVLIPNLLSYPRSCVVTDPKGELHTITAEHRRRKLGQKIVRLDPFGICGPGSDTYNPLLFIDASADDFLDQVRDLANMLVVRQGTEHEPHWNNSAELILTAFIAYICACEPNPAERTFDLLRELVSSRKNYVSVVKRMRTVQTHGGVISRLGHQLSWFKDKELSSVLTTVQRHTQWLDSPAVARNTATSSFDPRLIRSDTPVSVYLCLPHDRLVTLAPLMRIWVGTIIRVITRGTPTERNPVLFFLDEAGHLGKIQVLEDAVTLMRGMGIRLWFFYQSIQQLHTCFGDEASKIIDNIDTQQYFGTNSYFTADEISKRIGECTISTTSYGDSRGRSLPTGGTGNEAGNISSGTNLNFSDTGRRLLKPEEILILPDDCALIFHRNLPVIPSRLLRYYNAPEFRNGGTGIQPGSKIKADRTLIVILAVILVTIVIGVIRTAVQARDAASQPRIEHRHPNRGGSTPSRAVSRRAFLIESKRLTPIG